MFDENNFFVSARQIVSGMASCQRIFAAGYGLDGPTKEARLAAKQAWDELQVELVQLCAGVYREVGGEKAYVVTEKALEGVLEKHGSATSMHKLAGSNSFTQAVLRAAMRKSA